MKHLRIYSIAFLLLVLLASLSTTLSSSSDYTKQFRDIPNAAPSRLHLLGTDALGRDRFVRTLYGTRVSLLLAPAAAGISTVFAAVIGGLAGYLGGIYQKTAKAIIDLFLSLPWLFLLITVRALLPLNVSPVVSVIVTFALLGLLGWASAARIVCAGVSGMLNSDYVLMARAAGTKPSRIFALHVVPNVAPVLSAQFWIAVPVFILAEANLGMLGLGVAEPLPSWGSLLRELQDFAIFSEQYWRLAPLLLLVLVVTGFQFIVSEKEVPA